MTEPIDVEKRVLRTKMRALRTGLLDRPERSCRICVNLMARPDVLAADRIMVFESLSSEPDTVPFLKWCATQGKHTALPEDDDLDPTWPDVIVVPGLAFTRDGRRCGQGGGWYDRFLPQRRPDAVMIGVCFAPQLVDDLPTDEHDVTLHAIVTD